VMMPRRRSTTVTESMTRSGGRLWAISLQCILKSQCPAN
jgi:hypothetical protein